MPRLPLRLLALVGVALTLAGLVDARTFAAPYDTGVVVLDRSFDNPVYYGSANRGTGRIQLYVEGPGSNHAMLRAWVGGLYVTNAGPTLASYSETSTVTAEAVGKVSCRTVGQALDLYATVWEWMGDHWVSREDAEFASWECGYGTTPRVVSETRTGRATHRFEPGRAYLLLLHARGYAGGGWPSDSGAVGLDFCDEHPVCDRMYREPGFVRAKSIAIPNQGPRVAVESRQVWFATAASTTTTLTADACDPEGRIARVVIDFVGPTLPQHRDERTDAPCVRVQASGRFAAPGIYTLTVTAFDEEGASATASGVLRVTVLPDGPAVAVAEPLEREVALTVSTAGERPSLPPLPEGLAPAALARGP